MKKTLSLTRVLIAGFIATFAMTAIGLVGHHLGAPFVDWGSFLASHFGGNLLWGYFFFFMAGVVLGMAYGTILKGRLPGKAWQRGLFYGVLLWIVTGALLAPAFNLGFFMGSVGIALGTLLLYWVYGAVLGAVCD